MAAGRSPGGTATAGVGRPVATASPGLIVSAGASSREVMAGAVPAASGVTGFGRLAMNSLMVAYRLGGFAEPARYRTIFAETRHIR